MKFYVLSILWREIKYPKFAEIGFERVCGPICWNMEGGGLARRECGGLLAAQVEDCLEPSMELI